MKNKLLLWSITGILFFGTFSGCNIDQIDTDDIKIPNYTGDNGIAVGVATYTIREMINELQDSSLVIDEDANKLLKVIYRDTVLFDDVSEIVVIDDVSNPGMIQPGIDIPSAGVSEEITFEENLQFNYPIANDEELDSIIYRAGSIRLDIQSSFTVPLHYRLVIDDMVHTFSADTLIFEGDLNATGTDTQTFSLADFRTIAERIGINNVFTGTFNGTLFVSDGDNVQPSQSLDYQITIENVQFATIYGYFGQKDFELQNQTIDLKFFEGIDVGGFTFNSPELKITIDNFIGVPLGLDLANISSSNADGQTVNLNGTVTENLQLVRAPGINNVGSSLKSEIRINNSNSNLRDLLSNSPNQINMSVAATTNFNVTDPSENRNFVTDDGKADIFVEMVMPLDVKLQGFSRDFDFEMDSIDVSDADTVRLIVRSINLMPFTGMVDLQLIDPSETVLYEFQDILLIKSPILPLSGRAEKAEETVAVVKLFDESLDAFLQTTKLNLHMTVDSYQAADDQYVKIFSDYKLELKVAVQANLNIEIDL